MKVSKMKSHYLVCLQPGLALLALPHSGKAFELKEVWCMLKEELCIKTTKSSILTMATAQAYQSLDLQKLRKSEWTVSFNGQRSNCQFLSRKRIQNHRRRRTLPDFYVPYGYRGEISRQKPRRKCEQKPEPLKWQMTVYNGGKEWLLPD